MRAKPALPFEMPFEDRVVMANLWCIYVAAVRAGNLPKQITSLKALNAAEAAAVTKAGPG